MSVHPRRSLSTDTDPSPFSVNTPPTRIYHNRDTLTHPQKHQFPPVQIEAQFHPHIHPHILAPPLALAHSLGHPIHTPVSSRRHQPKRTHSPPVQLTHSHAHLPLSSSPLITIEISLPTSPTSPPSIYLVPSRSCQLSLTPVHTLSKKHLPCSSPISIAPILLSHLLAPPNF